MEKKEVEMSKAENAVKQEPKKLSYEQLENVCHQLSEQSRTLYQRLQEADMTNLFKRLDYLFAVIENKAAFPSDFTEECVKEIVASLRLPEKTEEEAKPAE